MAKGVNEQKKRFRKGKHLYRNIIYTEPQIKVKANRTTIPHMGEEGVSWGPEKLGQV